MIRFASFAAAALSAAALHAGVGVAAESAAAQASPLDPAAPATALPEPQDIAGGYRPLPALEPLPWRGLFDPAGAFVDHDRPAAGPQGERASRVRAAQAPLAQAAPPAGHDRGSADPSAAEALPAGADAVATVLRIDRDAQRVRLRHGPIRKLEMPGMTMLFRVADPALLDAVSVGETIGFRVEQRGQAFVVIDWVREGAK